MPNLENTLAYDFRGLVEGAPAVTYCVPLDRNECLLYASPQIEALLGFTAAELLADRDLYLRHLHPDDRERVLAEEHHCQTTGEPLRTEYRMLTRDGRLIWIHDEAIVVRDENGRPQLLQGIMLDVSDQHAHTANTTPDPHQLAEEIIRSLEAHHLPAALTLLETTQARHALRDADRLLHRLEDAIIQAASEAL